MDNYPYFIQPPKRVSSACRDPLWYSRRRHASALRGCGAACSCWYCPGDAALSVPLPLMRPRCRYPDCACVGAVLSCVRLCCVLGRGASSLRFYPWITAALLSRQTCLGKIPDSPPMGAEHSREGGLATLWMDRAPAAWWLPATVAGVSKRRIRMPDYLDPSPAAPPVQPHTRTTQ